MKIENLFELYDSQDDEGRSKIKEDFMSEYNNLNKQLEQLTDKNKKLQEINRNLVINSQRPIEDNETQEQVEKPITIKDLFEPVQQKYKL